jgi:hypothetical protein
MEMRRSLTPVSLVCASDLAGVAERASQDDASPTTAERGLDLKLSVVSCDRVGGEVSRAAHSGSGVVALVREAEDVTRLRMAGADRVVLVEGSSRDLGAEIGRATDEARVAARDRSRRVDQLSRLIADVQSGRAQADTLLAGIAVALLERPMKIVAGHAASRAYDTLEVLAALRSSVQIIARVHALQASSRPDRSADVAKLIHDIAPMLSIAFSSDLRTRVVTRGGPFLTTLADWWVAVVLLSVGVALAATPRATAEPGAEVGPHDDGVGPPSSSSHVLDGPLPGQNLLVIRAVGSRDGVAVEFATDVADADALSQGVVSADLGKAPDPASAALALAAQCLEACEGSVYADSGWHGGVIVTVFMPGSERVAVD